MEQSKVKLILGQIKKAKEKLKASESLIRKEFFDDCISRAYYAVFHAASAVLLAEGIKVRSHSGLKDMFGLHLVKTKKIGEQYGRIIKKLKDEREKGDYEGFTVFLEGDAERAVKEAEQFLKAMQQYLAKSHHLKF